MNLDLVAKHREEILWWEFCSWLHDVGKLSSDFLKYRQVWHSLDRGYAQKDPHDHGWFDWSKAVHDRILDGFPDLKAIFKGPPIDSNQITGELSVFNAVNHHIDPKDDLGRLLRAGDGCDAKYDRNNPLWGCEQTNHSDIDDLPVVYRSNVFGFEGVGDSRQVTGSQLDALRSVLYAGLTPSGLNSEINRFSADWKAYYHVRRLLQAAFEPAMSDTTRPDNDTSLWEHVFSVASVTKALHAHHIVTGEVVPEYPDARFHLLGVGVDSLNFLSSSHKIADIAARQRIIHELFDRTARYLEFEFPVGSEVYRDSSHAVFLVTRSFDLDLTDKLDELAWEISGGELTPHCWRTDEPVRNLTRLVRVLEELDGRFGVPTPRLPQRLNANFGRLWSKAEDCNICPICRLRPARKGDPKVCTECMDRRKTENRNLREAGDKSTLFLEEIADSNGRIAAVVARFGLREWLDGKMVRTCFVTEPQGVRKTLTVLDCIKDLEQTSLQDSGFKAWRASVLGGRIDLAAVYEGALKGSEPNYWATVFAQMGHTPEDDILAIAYQGKTLQRGQDAMGAIPVDLEEDYPGLSVTRAIEVNAACAKTPTPSTTLDVWMTTKEFFEGIAAPGLPARERRSFVIAPVADFYNGQAFDKAEIDGYRRQVVYRRDDNGAWMAILDSLADKTALPELPRRIAVTDDGGAEHTCEILGPGPAEVFAPFRKVASSPDFLMLLVPADQALSLTRKINERYRKEFGKVWGRLPLSVGNIFFHRYTPIFSVIDGAQRMVANFDRLHREPRVTRLCDDALLSGLGSLKLASGEIDYHHPYFLTEKPLADRESYFETLSGPVVHFKDAREEKILIYPNYYDCVWLGASADRFNTYINSFGAADRIPADQLRRTLQRPRGDAPVPIFLEDLEAKIDNLWKTLHVSHVSDSTLRHLEQTLVEKRASWRPAENAEHADAYLAFADSIVDCIFQKDTERAMLRAALREGYFEFTLNLYLRILKEPLDKET